MEFGDWLKNFGAAVTFCDKDGIILEMNEKSCEIFKKDGGRDLIGKNLFNCHPEPAGIKLKELIKNQKANCYTIEKNGIKKVIYQSPWYENQEYKGFVEIAFEIPFDMPHFIRKPG